MSITRQNENYWAMSPHDKISHHSPWIFGKIHYDTMLEFMGKRHVFNLLHTWELMQDANNVVNPNAKVIVD
jgi:hypothetical protein